jgi:hypothetical protein
MAGEGLLPRRVAHNDHLTHEGHVPESYEAVRSNGLATQWQVLLWDGSAHALAHTPSKKHD